MMNIDEINNRIAQLKNNIELLKIIRQDYIDQGKDDAFISALNDGINYTLFRLEKYLTTSWIMCD